VQKIKAAVDTRHDGDLQIIARTDARAVSGLSEAIDRAHNFVDAGADVTFVEAPKTVEELRIGFHFRMRNLDCHGAAIHRIGAVEEGILRRHTVTWSGRIRDTVYYSILDSEWPRVKVNLETKLTPRANGS